MTWIVVFRIGWGWELVGQVIADSRDEAEQAARQRIADEHPQFMDLVRLEIGEVSVA